MKIDLVSWMLLLFAVSLSSGHYIRQAEDNPDVYAAEDGSSGVIVDKPKPERPTLRQILYYHEIERDRGEHAVTERSFTNSHGYQFSEHPSSDEQDLPYDEDEHDDEYLREENEEPEQNDQDAADDFLRALMIDQDAQVNDDEDPESSTKPRPLTNEDVKEAYKASSYLFDQLWQRYAVKRMVDSLQRKKREAESEPMPDAPELTSDDEDRAARMQPNTFGMNIKPEGGYVWNNLNKPPSYYELGASNGNPNEGQNESQGQQNPSPGENSSSEQQSNTENLEAIDESPEPDDNADDLSDICVDINKPCALALGNAQAANANNPEDLGSNDSETNPFDTVIDSNESDDDESNDGVPNYPIGSVAFENPETVQSEDNSQPDAPNTYGMSLTSGGGHVWNVLSNPPVSYEVGSSNENPEPNNSEAANYPVVPVIGVDDSIDDSKSNDGAAANPMETAISENPEPSYPAEPAAENPEQNENLQESEMPQAETPLTEDAMESAGSNENSGAGYEESQQEETRPENSPGESSEGEKLMEIPEAPTLPPLNYDNSQDYINGATDGLASFEQTDNPYTNPQIPEDTKTMEENMGSILATMQPVEDIPQTYGMNLTSGGGHVWNTLVNPPVSYDIGSSNEQPDPNISEAKPVEPVATEDTSSNDSESNEEATYPQGPQIYENPEPSYPVEAVAENPDAIEGDANNQPDEPNTNGMNLNPDGDLIWNTMLNPPVPYDIGSSNEHSDSINENNNSEHADESSESYGSGNQGSQSEEQEPASTPQEGSEGEKPKEPISTIPEAPTLPPLNYDNLPDYIKNSLSSTEKPGYDENTENPYINPQTNPEDKKTMEDKMEDIFATMKPAENEPDKTYGMSLNPDGGHVWNDMVNPPISYYVGSSSQSEEEHKKETTQAPESNEQPESYESEEPKDPITEPAEPEKEEGLEEPIANQENPELVPQIPETEDSKPIEEPGTAEMEEPEGAEPSEENQEEQEHKEETSQAPESNEQPESYESEEHKDLITEPAESESEEGLEEPIANQENPELVPQIPETEDSKPIEGPETAEVEKPEGAGHSEENQEEQDVEPIETKPEEGNAKPDIMNELLKSEQFWRWLGVWTATYMELLEKHIRKIAIQEICNHQKIGTQMCLIDEYSEDSDLMTNEKITVDDKEMDLTHRDNLDKEQKRGHHNQNNDNKGTNGNKIEASTIYGNSVGNEKVTNVYIFTADKADEVIDKLKPKNGSEIDFIIDERVKEDAANADEVSKEESNEDKPNNEEFNKEGSNESDVNAEEFDNEAKKEEPSQSEAIEEELNKEAANKDESNEADANGQELNNEEADKEESTEIEPNTEDLNTNKEESVEDVGNNEENDKQEANKESFEGETNDEEKPNKEEPIESERGEEELDNEEVNKEASIQSDSNKEDLNKEEANKDKSREDEVNEKELNKEEPNKEGEENNDESNKVDDNKEVSNESEVSKDEQNKEEANKNESKGDTNEEELDKEAANKEEANEEDLNKEEKNKEESNEGDVNEEKLNKEEDNKEDSIDSEANKEKNEAGKKGSDEGAANGEELNKEEANEEDKEENNKEESNEGDVNEEELKKEEDNKEESIDSEANEDKKAASKEGSDEVAANEDELNKEEAKEDETNEESNQNKDSELEADVDKLSKDS